MSTCSWYRPACSMLRPARPARCGSARCRSPCGRLSFRRLDVTVCTLPRLHAPRARRRSAGGWSHLLDLPAQHTLECHTLCECVQYSRAVRRCGEWMCVQVRYSVQACNSHVRVIESAGPARRLVGQTAPLHPELQRPSCNLRGDHVTRGDRRFSNFHAHDSRAEPQAERSREMQKLAAFFKLSIYQTYSTPP